MFTIVCLQALVLSFALFLGTWSPLAGGGLELQTTVPLSMPIAPGMGAIREGVALALADDAGGKVPMGPELADPYNTPNGMCQTLCFRISFAYTSPLKTNTQITAV